MTPARDRFDRMVEKCGPDQGFTDGLMWKYHARLILKREHAALVRAVRRFKKNGQLNRTWLPVYKLGALDAYDAVLALLERRKGRTG